MCKSNFLQYYQVISAIPKIKDLLHKTELSDLIRKELYSSENFTQIFLNSFLNSWKKSIYPLKIQLKETKLKEFQFKLIHCIIATKKELFFFFGIKPDDDCLCCGEKDSIDHSFKDCRFVISFDTEVIKWFNARNNSKFNPSIGEKLFGLDKGPHNKELLKKFNYTMLFMGCYCRFSHDVTKNQTTELLILLIFYFSEVYEQLKTNIWTNFCSEWVLGFAIGFA